MRYCNNPLTGITALLLMLFCLPLRAENIQDFGDYVVHYNALTTDMIPPSVAQEYDLQRSKNRAMLNIVVLKKVLGASGQPIEVRISGHATTITGNRREIDFREIQEANAIYYIADFLVDHEQHTTFTIEVTPEGEPEPLTVKFRKQFFTD